MIPLGLLPYVVAILVALAAAGGGWWRGYKHGVQEGAEALAKRTGEVVALRAEIDRANTAVAEAEAKTRRAGEAVRIEYIERVKKIPVKADPIILERVRVETRDCPTVAPALVQLWNGPDGAGDSKDPATGRADVAATELAETISEAKRRFDINAARLDALQQLIRSQP